MCFLLAQQSVGFHRTWSAQRRPHRFYLAKNLAHLRIRIVISPYPFGQVIGTAHEFWVVVHPVIHHWRDSHYIQTRTDSDSDQATSSSIVHTRGLGGKTI
ncbi:hypothetical protein SUGI_1019420 [Cryptomeria japonica]|nr:hypothetical protein SUGI_1019420 [Cryptomeria japonica]